ncbi:tetratricopeptide repeat protein [Streptomyces sp. ODS28]|uniref:tetratricopeptide repeat protein n=1 Tax=Streptomyces sp. ODS28 TaxID=3136688 RepID=UPI0031EF859C
MASSPSASPEPQEPRRAAGAPESGPNTAFRRLRGSLSPGEFAASVRRAAREIGEKVSCDARYVGRVEAGEIRCPNYAYERVFLHMFPGYSLSDMGFAPREAVRGRSARTRERAAAPAPAFDAGFALPRPPLRRTGPGSGGGHQHCTDCSEFDEESDVLRRAFMTGGSAALAAGALGTAPAYAVTGPTAVRGRAGASEATALEKAVRHIRVLDDRHGADTLYRRAGQSLRAAQELLDGGTRHRAVAERLHSGAGELAISVGWLAHDSGRFDDARSHYAEALATARVAADPALEAHAFCNTAFLARDAGRPREAVRAAQAGQHAAKQLGSDRLLALLALREAGGWAGLLDRPGCEQALGRARALFERGPSDADPEWMTFFGEAELEGLEAQCWSALGCWHNAAEHARGAVRLQDPHFVRNRALFTAELADDLACAGRPDEAAHEGSGALALLGPVQSSRIRGMLARTARRLRPYAEEDPTVRDFLTRMPRTA